LYGIGLSPFPLADPLPPPHTQPGSTRNEGVGGSNVVPQSRRSFASNPYHHRLSPSSTTRSNGRVRPSELHAQSQPADPTFLHHGHTILLSRIDPPTDSTLPRTRPFHGLDPSTAWNRCRSVANPIPSIRTRHVPYALLREVAPSRKVVRVEPPDWSGEIRPSVALVDPTRTPVFRLRSRRPENGKPRQIRAPGLSTRTTRGAQYVVVDWKPTSPERTGAT